MRASCAHPDRNARGGRRRSLAGNAKWRSPACAIQRVPQTKSTNRRTNHSQTPPRSPEAMTDKTTSRRATLSGRHWIAVCVGAHAIASHVLMPVWFAVAQCPEPQPPPGPPMSMPLFAIGFTMAPVVVPMVLAHAALTGFLEMLWGRILFIWLWPWLSYGAVFGLSALLLAYAFRRGWVRGLVRRNDRWLRLGRKTNGT